MAHRIVSVQVDVGACASHWACILPDSKVFVDGGDYYPHLTEDAACHFQSRRREIIQAVLSCPTSALSLRFEDGTVITSEDWEETGGVEKWVQY